MDKYEHVKIEKKWQARWVKEKLFTPDVSKAEKPFYNLMMFPYPSAEGLHVGNMYAFVGSDIYGRFKRMQGYSVFEPIGLDGFGIHSENYAIKVGKHPKEQAKISEKNFYRQLEATGNGYDWTRTLETYDPAYYKWTQWIFLKLLKAGLAYRAKSEVNFCPSCKTVLADEQVVQKAKGKRQKAKVAERIGVCERCATPVEKKELEQWFFRITKYADRLLGGLDKIDWSEQVKVAQKNWIGKKEGAVIKFKVHSSQLTVDKISVFTTRPDTLFGATFLVLSPEHPVVTELLKLKEISQYVERAKRKSDLERLDQEKEKTGVFSGLSAINPATEEKIPIWIADYVLAAYGTGAIMAVPAHDARDFDFAKQYNLSIKKVIILKKSRRVATKAPPACNSINTSQLEAAYEGEGKIMNSGPWNGWRTPKDLGKVINWLEEKGLGKRKTSYHLRDWLISRQRYWGPPIPVIYCRKCRDGQLTINDQQLTEGIDYAVIDGKEHAIIPVFDEDLPVILPDVSDWRPKGTGKSPLASVESFVKVACPKCGATARRETDVSDTFLDSAWYFLRYPSVGNTKSEAQNSKQATNSNLQNSKSKSLGFRVSGLEFPWQPELTRRWFPVDMYIGGAEHAVLHLLYTRFLTMVFKDLNLLSFAEPFTRFRAHGLLISKGAKMSKSKGNIVNPDDYIEKYGSDTLRCYLMFCGKFKQGGDFRDAGIEGMARFLKRVWQLFNGVIRGPVSSFLPVSARSNGNVPNADSKSSELRAVGNPSTAATPRDGNNLQIMHKTIKQVTEDIESLDYNTAISALMIWLRALEKRVVDSSQLTVHSQNKNKKPPTVNRQPITREEVKNFLLLLASFAPHMTEELWQIVHSSEIIDHSKKNQKSIDHELQAKLTKNWSIHFAPWPKFDEKLARSDKIEFVIQVNGRLRGRIEADRGLSQKEAEKLALASQKVKKYVSGKDYKAVYVRDKLINFVLR